MFIHRKSDLITEFLQIRTSSNFTLKLSEDHLIPIVLCSQEMSLSLLSNGERFVSVNSQPAKLAEPGLCVVSLINDQFVLDAIVAVDKVRAKGIFAPITKSGNILVNGMLTSCYSGYDNNGFQRTIFNFVSKISSWWLGTSYINVGNEDLEIPTILQVFLQITELFDFKY